MRLYTADNADRIYLSPYAGYVLSPEEVLFENHVTGQAVKLKANALIQASLIRTLENGGETAFLKSILDTVSPDHGESLFAALIQKGIIE